MEELTVTFQARMDQYDEDLRILSGNEAAHKSVASISKEFMEFKCLIWKTVATLKTQMELLIVGLDRLEMTSRKPVLLLHGLPEKKDEDCVSQAVTALTDKVRIPNVKSTDIAVCHRLGSGADKSRPLLIRFHNLVLRNEVWRKKTSLKGSGLILSEFLTKPRHATFQQARKHFGVKECWTSEGKIVILCPDKRRRKVESSTELQKLKTQFPDANSEVATSAAVKASQRSRKPVK